MDVKTALWEIHELLGSCPDAENLAEVALAKLVLKELSPKGFQREIAGGLKSVAQNFMKQMETSADDEFSAYRNAWYDVARYQTDPIDAAITWDADPESFQILLEARPVPTDAAAKQALSVPLAVKKLRENMEGPRITPEMVANIRRPELTRKVPAITKVVTLPEDRRQLPWIEG
jgi:hypothetical protein